MMLVGVARAPQEAAEIGGIFDLFERLFTFLLFVMGLVASLSVSLRGYISHVGEGPVGRATWLLLIQRAKMDDRWPPSERCWLFDIAVVVLDGCNVDAWRCGRYDHKRFVFFLLFLSFLLAADQLKSDGESQAQKLVTFRCFGQLEPIEDLLDGRHVPRRIRLIMRVVNEAIVFIFNDPISVINVDKVLLDQRLTFLNRRVSRFALPHFL